MNKIVNKKADLKNQQRSNYHQQSNVKSREGSSSVQTRRRQISSVFTNSSTSQNSRSSYETISKSRSQSSKKNSSSPRQRSTTPLKSVKGRKPTPIPPKRQQGQQPCKFWMEGRCNKFEQCKFRHYQMSQILFKQNKLENKVELINQEQNNNHKILVKIEQTSLITQAELMQIAQRAPEGLSTAIKISYKNKKAINKLKNKLNKNQKDLYINNEQKNAQEEEILNELLKNTQIDNKNKNAQNIKEKIEKIKKEQSERAQILKNKPKITLIKEREEKQVQNQQPNQNQQYEEIQNDVQESDEQSDEEIDMTNYNQQNQKKLNNIINDNNKQINNQFNQLNQSQIYQSQNNLEKHKQNPSSHFNKYTEVLSPQQKDLNQEAQSFQPQIPSTLMSPTYIQEKDKQKNDNQTNQNQIKDLFGEEIQQDMKWSQNIKSVYQQWKQYRDGKNQINIHPNSEEPSKQFPINSIEQQEIVDQSNLKLLYDWKKIYKSKAYRNDSLQNFISYQHPKLINYENNKVFNLATEFLNEEALLPEFQYNIKEIQKLIDEKQANGTLNIFYNKALLDKSLEEYNSTEITEQFFYATESPQKSQIYKMAIIINRYIKNLIQQIMQTKIKNIENQKINISQDQFSANQLAIIETLRLIIIQNNTDPHKMYYLTNQGTTIVSIYSHHSLDWTNIEKQNQKQNQK